jgi:cytochrome oxidase Cu insertion factor (SCO1/SenC/PrrC family)/copper(I)-binding protein
MAISHRPEHAGRYFMKNFSQSMLSMIANRWSLVTSLLFAACVAEGSSGAYRGVALPTPLAKPSFTLTDFTGQPYDVVAQTRDKVTLIFFGYTHCPDICPLHMANIAAVLKRMPAGDQARVVTIFVTTDPERDTPQRLREWLGNFDPSFVGLTGSTEQLAQVQRLFSLPEATREYVNADSTNYFVGHGAQVFAFARDGNAYTIYPFGIRQEDWANDLPRLVNATGAEIRRDLAAQAKAEELAAAQGKESSIRMEGLVVTQAVVAEPASLDEAAAYITIRNGLPQEDTLVAVAADIAVRGEVHQTMGEGELRHMMATPALVIPARAETKLAPNGTHIMLRQLKKKVTAGDSVTLYLSLARVGPIEVRAPVVPYAELEKFLGDGKSVK